MREILFRGKNLNNGKWITGNFSKESDGLSSIRPIGKIIRYQVIPETVGQFTGLIDKKGNKIFEGDIVRCFNSKGQGGMHYAVKWCDETSMFILVCEGDYLGFDTDFTVFSGEDLEIIGNVHDNPELLEGE